MRPFVLAAACAALLGYGCGGTNLVPAGGAEADGTFVPQADTTGVVTEVGPQGDLVLADGRRVTLAGIDLSTTADACAAEGRDHLERLTAGQAVAIDTCDVSGAGGATDDLTAMVIVTTPGQEAFVNVEMLRAGFASASDQRWIVRPALVAGTRPALQGSSRKPPPGSHAMPSSSQLRPRPVSIMR